MTTLMQVAENVAIDLLDGLATFDDGSVSAMVMQDVSRGYAMIGACYLLQRRNQATFRTWLALGAQAYAQWLSVAPPSRHTHAHAEPFLYAVLAGDATLCAQIHQRLRSDFNQGCEYEEDFAFARILQVVVCSANPLPEVTRLLVFWRGISGGGEPEFAIAEALVARDGDALHSLLFDRLEARQTSRRREQRERSGNPDERLALGRIDLETAALLTIARDRLGMTLTIDHRLLPPELLPPALASTAVLPTNAWRDEERYHVYRDQ
jgi:Immunity protein 49